MKYKVGTRLAYINVTGWYRWPWSANS